MDTPKPNITPIPPSEGSTASPPMPSDPPAGADDLARSEGVPGKLAAGTMYLLTAIAAGLSLFLAYYAGSEADSIPGCGAGGTFDCGHVLKSKWSSAFGIPVGFIAAAAYAAVFMALPYTGRVATPRVRRFAWSVLLIAATGIVAAAAWFITLQTVAIKSFCIYCVMTHATGLALAVTIFASAPCRASSPAPGTPGTPGTPPMIPLARVLLCVWLGLMTPIFFAAGVRPQYVFLLRDFQMPVRINPEDFPALGDPTRGKVVMSLSDYTCPHCRATHEYLISALGRYGNNLAVVVLPMPLESKCNPRVRETEKIHVNACELARLALTVWRAKPETFAEYDRWLYEPERPRDPAEARIKAMELVGDAAFQKAAADPWVERTLGMSITLYDKLGGGAIPKLLTPTSLVVGQPENEQELFGIFEHECGIKPAAGVAPAPKPRAIQSAPRVPARSATQPSP